MGGSGKLSYGKQGAFLGAIIGALGIVYGDIGTSPLYAINFIFFGATKIPTSPENVYGAIGLVFWALTLIITLKYIVFVLRADNKGEGGVFVLFGFLREGQSNGLGLVAGGILLASGLLLGDGLITPAISVLSAVEGLKVATDAFEPYIIPITIAILVALFALQKRGTEKVGALFGPVIMVWFIVIGILGAWQIMKSPGIFWALNPIYAWIFMEKIGLGATFAVLGAVMLVVTGGEALYADMGHVGRRPIRFSWMAIVFPALLLNYFGQGAYLLSGGNVAHENIFFSLVPRDLLYPMVLLATLATIIASQALITGTFSLVAQAMALDVSPKFKIVHTSRANEQQIYLPAINWMLCIGCVVLVIEFRTSHNLGSAYGFSVAGVMLVTSVALLLVSRRIWKWSWFKSTAIFGTFAVIDAVFLTANSLKFFDGAYVPLMIGGILFVCMTAWRWGRRLILNVYDAYRSQKKMFQLSELNDGVAAFDARPAVFLVSRAVLSSDDDMPLTFRAFAARYGYLPKKIYFLTIEQQHIPSIGGNRYSVKKISDGIVSIRSFFGFMEQISIKTIIAEIQRKLNVDLSNAYLEVGEVKIGVHESAPFFLRQRARFFRILLRFSTPVYDHFGIADYMEAGKTPILVLIHRNGASIRAFEPKFETGS